MNIAMNSAAFLAAQPWVERLGWTLLHFLWEGVVIAKLFILARWLAGRALRAQARYLLACAAMAAMALAPVATFGLIGGGSALIPANPSAWSARPFAAAGSNAAKVAMGAWHLPIPAFSQQALPWIVAAWLCGALLFSMRLAGGWALAARTKSAGSARLAPHEWQRTLDRMIERVGGTRPVRLLVSSLAHAPMAIGLLRPAILMPVGALAGLPVEQVEALLAHELAHIRRHDYLVNLLQSVVEAMLFYHPAVWWISSEIRAEREHCCDDDAVAMSGDVLTYARALAAVETHRPARLRTAMAANGGSLVNRIRRLIDPLQPMPHAHSGPGAAAALAILLLAGIGAAAMDRSSKIAPVLPTAHVVEIPQVAASQAPERPVAQPLTRRQRTVTSPPEPRIRPLRAQVEAQTPALEMPPASFERAARELELRSHAGNFEARTWSAVDGEPILRAVEFRGMSEEFAADLRARLPVHEGERVTHAAREEIGDIVRGYGRRLEFGMSSDGDGGAVLRIHPPGEAGAPLVFGRPKR